MESIEIKNYHPKELLAIYNGDSGDYYIERHKVNTNGTILAGRPLNVKELSNLGKALIRNAKSHAIHFNGLLPNNVVLFRQQGSESVLAWVVKSKCAPMYFTKDLNIREGNAWHPDMLFVLNSGTLSVFWLKSDVVTDESTLYVAPYHNVSDTGVVCLGTAKRDMGDDAESVMSRYEDLFFLSKFSHVNSSICGVIKFNLNTFWANRINKEYSFKDKDFIESTVTINDLING